MYINFLLIYFWPGAHLISTSGSYVLSQNLWIKFLFYISLTVKVLMTLRCHSFIYFPQANTPSYMSPSTLWFTVCFYVLSSGHSRGTLPINICLVALCKSFSHFLDNFCSLCAHAWWLLSCLFLSCLIAPLRSPPILNDKDMKLRPPQKIIWNKQATLSKSIHQRIMTFVENKND